MEGCKLIFALKYQVVKISFVTLSGAAERKNERPKELPFATCCTKLVGYFFCRNILVLVRSEVGNNFWDKGSFTESSHAIGLKPIWKYCAPVSSRKLGQ